jgi:hypothetical protein
MPYQRVLSTGPKRPRGKKAKQSLNWVVKKGSMHGGKGSERIEAWDKLYLFFPI